MKAYLLAGPTAVGKTALTQSFAEELGISILSTDSMQVYRGMDIGTAKPTTEERGNVIYHGIDLVDPDTRFSAGDYLRAVNNSIADDATVLATGGTGLYLKALAIGLDEMPDANPALRAQLESLYEADGLAALQAELKKRDATWLAEMPDPENARRLVRAIELAEAGIERPQRHSAQPKLSIPGLTIERPVLHERIAQRVGMMFDQGLLAEVEHLRTTFPIWSSTAAQAIGYAEAIAVLDGEMTVDEAKEKIAIRTRQYAKRQFTWLNNQFDVVWVDVTDHPAQKLRAYWEAHGPVELAGC
jgi:tRNA dimethylallyltransferase